MKLWNLIMLNGFFSLVEYYASKTSNIASMLQVFLYLPMVGLCSTCIAVWGRQTVSSLFWLGRSCARFVLLLCLSKVLSATFLFSWMSEWSQCAYNVLCTIVDPGKASLDFMQIFNWMVQLPLWEIRHSNRPWDQILFIDAFLLSCYMKGSWKRKQWFAWFLYSDFCCCVVFLEVAL